MKYFEREIGSSHYVLVVQRGELIDVSGLTLASYAPLTMMLEWRTDIFYEDGIFIIISTRIEYIYSALMHYSSDKEYAEIISKILKQDYESKIFTIEIKSKFEVFDLEQ